MNSINWTNFDGNLFQQFCNALILYEVNKHARVYSAPGKDGGIDQYFIGVYGDKRGKWRFQDKFHSNQTGNAAQNSALTRDIKEDIRVHFIDEDYIVYLTNANLLPQQEEKLIEAAKASLLKVPKKDVEVFIWHHAKIEALLAGHPLVFFKFWQKDQLVLESYQDYFKSQLDKNNTNLRSQLHNDFVGRASSMEKLTAFLDQNGKSTIAIIANGGFGKTKLCIEFFQKVIDARSDWYDFVLNNNFLNCPSISSIENDKKYIILLDDAHESNNPKAFAEIKRIADNSLGRIKIIITVRKSFYEETLAALPSRSQDVEPLYLEKLNYEETHELFKTQLSFLKEEELYRLADNSKGVPNVILELCYTILQGKQPHQISEEENFSRNVKAIVNESVEDVCRVTFFDKRKVLNFIRFISLLSPLPYNDEYLEELAEVAEFKLEDLKEVIQQLINTGILQGNYTLSISPDPYSDTILIEALKNKSWFARLLESELIGNNLENVVKNVSAAELAKPSQSSICDTLLNKYISKILDSDLEEKQLVRIIKAVSGVAYLKPAIATKTIEYFTEIYKNSNHPLHNKFDFLSKSSFLKEEIKNIEKLFEIIFINTHSLFEFNNRFALLEKFIKLTDDFAIINRIARYREFDFNAFGYRPLKCCERQTYFKNKVIEYLQSKDDFKHRLALTACESLLALDFNIEGYYNRHRNALSFGKGSVPECEHTREIRLTLVASLIEYYNSEISSVKDKQDVLVRLLRMLFFVVIKDEREKEKRFEFNQNDEVELIFTFLFKLLRSSPDINTRSKILCQTRLFKRKELKEEYREQIDLLDSEANQVNSLKEKLNLLLLSDYFTSRDDYFKRSFLKIFDKYKSFENFQIDFLEIRATMPNDSFHKFTDALNILAKDFPQKAKSLFEFVFKNHPEYISAAVLLVRGNYKEKDYFYEVIEKLWLYKSGAFREQVIWLLTYGRESNKDFYRERDFYYLEEYIYNSDINSLRFIIHNFGPFAYVNKERTFKLLTYILDAGSETIVEEIFASIVEENKSLAEDFAVEVKDLILNHSSKARIDDYYFGKALNFLETKFGFETLFDFLINRVEHQRDEYQVWGFSPTHHYENHQLAEEDNIKRFFYALNWYIQSDSEIDYENRKLLEFFMPSKEVNQTFFEEFEKVILANYKNPVVLIKLGELLEEYDNKNELLLILIVKLSDTYIRTEAPDFKYLYRIFGSSILYSLGSKSKSGKGPYPQDLERKRTLLKVLEEQTMEPETREMLLLALESTQKSIDNELKDDESDW